MNYRISMKVVLIVATLSGYSPFHASGQSFEKQRQSTDSIPSATSSGRQGPTISQSSQKQPGSPLAGTAWQLVRLRRPDGTLCEPKDSSLYLIEFAKDGTCSLRADCNRATGSYSIVEAGSDEEAKAFATPPWAE